MIDQQHERDAMALLGDSLVWDNHACMPLRPEDPSFLPQLFDVHKSGVDVVSVNAGFGPIDTDTHLAMLESFHAFVEANAAQISIVSTLADIDSAKAAGRLAVFFDVEGMAPLNDGRLDLVETFRNRGVGWMLIAYNKNNDAGGGCYDEDTGLTDYGRDVLAEMKRVGMMVCCSHTGHRTAMEVIEHADAPVIFSHSNAASVYEHARNIPDALITAAAQTGGVVGVNGIGGFLGEGGHATPERIANHIDHMVTLVGPSHVGVGLDYVYDQAELLEYLQKMRSTFPDDDTFTNDPELFPSTKLGQVVAILLSRGYTHEDLRLILGENWRRVAQQVWEAPALTAAN